MRKNPVDMIHERRMEEGWRLRVAKRDARIAIRLPANLLAQLQKLANDQRRSVSSVCCILLEDAMRDMPSMSAEDVAMVVMPSSIFARAKRK